MRHFDLICREILFFNNVTSLKYDAINFKISFLSKSYKYNLRYKKISEIKTHG